MLNDWRGVDKVNLPTTTRAGEIPDRISQFLTAAQIPMTWGRFLLEVLSDPDQAERLRSTLDERLSRTPDRDPLARLFQDHLAPSSSYMDQIGLVAIYEYYSELCQVAGSRPVPILFVEERIAIVFPGAIRRYSAERGAHYCCLCLVTGKGTGNV